KSLANQTAGAGEYVYVPAESVVGNKYVLVPNKRYYNQSAIRFSKVVVRVIPSATTRFAAIRSGQLDAAEGDLTTVDSAKSAGLDVVSVLNGWAGIMILDRGPKTPDGKQPNPLAKVEVRQALNYAIDRATITKAIVGENGKATAQMAA